MSIYEYDKEFEEKKLRKAEYEAGVEAGIELGERSLLENQIRKKLKKGKPIEQIADELEEAVTTIQRIIEETKKRKLSKNQEGCCRCNSLLLKVINGFITSTVAFS